MASPTYTAWPVIADVYLLLTGANITPALTVSSTMSQGMLDAAIQVIGQKTKRQFLPSSAGVVRYFNGSGTGVQVVNEYIDITAVEFLMYPQVAGIDIQYWYEVGFNLLPNTMLEIFQGPANTNYGYVANFPEGRSNIKVTGTWGYASSIPADVWMAVVKKAAAGIAAANSVSAQGKVHGWTDGDAREDYDKGTPGEVAGWLAEFDDVVKRYMVPMKERRRRQVASLL